MKHKKHTQDIKRPDFNTPVLREIPSNAGRASSVKEYDIGVYDRRNAVRKEIKALDYV